MIVEIKHRFTNSVLCSFEAVDIKDCLQQAVKSGANLLGANLRGANLRGEKIAIAPVSIGGLIWNITITESYLTIGCQHHLHSEWSKFTDEEIENMESRALEFWKQNKSWLLAACKSHRKESLAYRKANPESEA